MNGSLLYFLGGGLANALMVLLLAPLLEGILRRLTARIQSRQGPPLLQPYFDLLKLLGKEDLESGTVPAMQRFATLLSMGTTLTIAGFLPLGLGVPFNDAGDVITLVYLLTVSAIAGLLAGLAAGSTYSMIGISREMIAVITLEPLLVMALLTGALQARSLRLREVLDGALFAGSFRWSGLLLLGVLLFSFQAFLKRIPFDTAEAETELMEGPLMEYSGPKLALFKHAQMARLILYSALLVGLFAPWGSHWIFPLSWLAFWAKVLGLVVLATLIAATHARYRIDQTIRYFAGLMVISLVALILAGYGY